MHSPHSPLHPHSQVNQQIKLSARYINNKAVNEEKNISSHTRQTNTTTSPKRSCTCTSKFRNINTNYDISLKTEIDTAYKDRDIILPLHEKTDDIPPYKHTSPLPLLVSNLICSCEKEDPSKHNSQPLLNVAVGLRDSGTVNGSHKSTNSLSINKTIKSPPVSVSKRLVATRNAATSPHLDMRKLGSMMTVVATVSHAFNNKDDKSDTLSIATTTTTATLATSAAISTKLALEKSNSLGESKPQKQLRTTRSLSPRPPVRHQQSIIVSDENEVISVKLSLPSKNRFKQIYEAVVVDNDFSSCSNKRDNGHILHRKLLNTCRSEQTSPNTTDLFDLKFAYNQPTNRSTGCLVYVPTDPWMKMGDQKKNTLMSSMQKSNDTQICKKLSSYEISTHANERVKIQDDPWVIRTDTIKPRSPKQERFRQVKSFSATKFDVGGDGDGDGDGDCGRIHKKNTLLRSKLHRSKSPFFTGDDGLVPDGLPLQSAPTSPHFLKTPENPFSSAFSLSYPYSIQPSSSSPRSASFSPVRAKTNPIQNIFDSVDSTVVMSTSPPPSISVAAALAGEQQLQQRMNHSLLDVCNPNLLQARHSFSSVSNQQHEEELQLNIRRLSEQMRQTNKFLGGALKIALSDRNVSGGGNNFRHPVSSTQSNARGADFSDYLKQFRCIEARKATKTTKKFITPSGIVTTHAVHSSSNISVNPHKSQSHSEPLLETTC